jgi:hypothetical protein
MRVEGRAIPHRYATAQRQRVPGMKRAVGLHEGWGQTINQLEKAAKSL